jgi:purine nucleosidase
MRMAFSMQNIVPRMRVILDNDFGGDPDGLFQLAHHAMSPSAEIVGIIGSFFTPGTCFGAPDSAAHACAAANELLAMMGLTGKFPVYEGASTGLLDERTPVITEGARAIVREAMRDDTDLPLSVACGAGLTDIASAFLLERGIARRLTLLWIGGPEYPDGTPPPGKPPVEYNLRIDITAARVVFNHSGIPIWQVPRDAYPQALLSHAELALKVESRGKIGKYLADRLGAFIERARAAGLPLGETYVLGDSPLVLLTALQSAFNPDTSSSRYVRRSAPKITDAGSYEENPAGRMIRVYARLDSRLLFEDFFAKLALFDTRG